VSAGSKYDAGFTNDPVFGDLIRRAQDLGFTFVSYEMDPHCGPGPQKAGDVWMASYGACIERREQGQAQNLARFLETHPAAKLVVHAGGGHIQKMKFDFGPMMAWNFRELTKIDPLCIDQIYMSERSEPAMEEPEYQLIAPKYADRTAPFVLHSRDGFFRPGAAEGTDIAVIHPRAVYENGRPAWLSTGGWRKPSPIAQLSAYQAAVPALQKAGTTLLQVFVITDGPDAVPVDQFLITEPLRPAAPMVPDGKYRLRVVDRDGKTLAAFNLEMP
jgi:hypothetical protein